MEIPHDKIINDVDVLTEKYNVWRDALLSRLAQWKQASQRLRAGRMMRGMYTEYIL